jgi:hypothetical protein
MRYASIGAAARCMRRDARRDIPIISAKYTRGEPANRTVILINNNTPVAHVADRGGSGTQCEQVCGNVEQMSNGTDMQSRAN